jgi:hypothetical protein
MNSRMNVRGFAGKDERTAADVVPQELLRLPDIQMAVRRVRGPNKTGTGTQGNRI